MCVLSSVSAGQQSGEAQSEADWGVVVEEEEKEKGVVE